MSTVIDRHPKIVFFDIETLPDFKEIIKVYTSLSDYPGKTIKADITTMICFGYMLLEDNEASCISIWDKPDVWLNDINDDYHLVKFAYELLKDADLLVTHNGKKFDLKFLNTRIAYHKYNGRKDKDLKFLPPINHLDTILIARRNFLLVNNKLGNVAKLLNAGKKTDTGGWSLWVDVFNKIEKAQNKMTKYCKQDVLVVKKIFKKIRALSRDIPNYNLFYDSEKPLCANCGSTHVHSKGVRRTKTQILQRFVCVSCGTWLSKKKNNIAKTL